LLARRHQLKIGEKGIVGIVASTGKPRIALDVGEDAVFFNNPDLPDTHSELALPLTIGDKVVGVLDVQSTVAGAFDQEDLQVLSILADQVSLAIENARLFQESNKSLAEAEALYRQYLRQAWGRVSKERRLEGYHYSSMGAIPIEKFDEGKLSNQAKRPEIAVPIHLRGESIGTLSVQVPEASQVNEDQLDIIKAVAERVAISAENARLFDETTRRAERERLVTDITAKIRSTNDPDNMIQIALTELKTALGATRVQLIPHTLQHSQEAETRTSLAAPSPGKSKKGSNNPEI
jgi:GAF domain-containing protein